MIWLHKILPLFMLPLGLALGLVALGLLLRRRLPVALGFALLWVFSLPITGDALTRWIERDAVRLPLQSMPNADAIVVLSGIVRTVNAAPGAQRNEWTDGIDRIEAGVALWQAGKAPVLVLTGGQVPWLPEAPPESQILSQWAQTQGIPSTAILHTPPVANTEQEAAAIAAMLPNRAQVLLVTSAFHMPRAEQLFKREGFEVIAFPVDLRSSAGKTPSVLDWLPSADALGDSSRALREWIGQGWYALRSIANQTLPG